MTKSALGGERKSGAIHFHLWDWAFKPHQGLKRSASPSAPLDGRQSSIRLFLVAFLLSCVLFWWLASFLYRFVLNVPDPVKNWALSLSCSSVFLFIAGYKLPRMSLHFKAVSDGVLQITENFAYRVVLALSLPVSAIALLYAKKLAGSTYGSSLGVPFLAQAVFYPYLFVGLMFLGTARPGKFDARKVLLVSLLMILPRIAITLHYARFFAAQAIVPILFLAVAKEWIRLTKKQLIILSAIAMAIIFVPAYTRGDKMVGTKNIVSFFATGSTLQFVQDNVDLNLDGRCSPLLVSLTAKVIPYHTLGMCTIDYEGLKGEPATLERILTVNEVGSADDTGVGTGSNYMLELYLSGGMIALVLGSIAFGYCSKLLVFSLAGRSLFNGIWAMCLSRALFAPRSNLGYVFELVPGYIVATLFTASLACAIYGIARQRNNRGSEAAEA